MSWPEKDAPSIFGLSVRVHRTLLIVATFGGFFGGVFLGERLIGGVWAEIIGAILGTMLLESLFHRLVPARCPACGGRARCHLSHQYFDRYPLGHQEGQYRSATVIHYDCRACGYEWPRRVPTQADVATAVASGIRVARFAKGFFTLIGVAFTVIAAAIAAHRLTQGDFQTAAIAVGMMAMALGFTFVTRRVTTDFSEAIRNGTRQMTAPARPASEFMPLEGVVDGVRYNADSLSFGNVEVWIDLPQRQMRRPQLYFDTRSAPFDPNEAEWGAEQIQALFDLGATDVDVAYHSDCIQVVFPQDRVTVTPEFAEQVATLMVALRTNATMRSLTR